MEENKNAYSEVIEILKLIDDEEKLEKLPMEMLELLKSKVNPEYKPQISMDIPLEEQNLEPETLSILAWITMKYWDIDKKADVEKIDDNMDIENSEIKEIVESNSNVIENNIKLDTQEDKNTLLPIVHNDLKWYERIKIKIIEFFNKLLKKRNLKEERGNA